MIKTELKNSNSIELERWIIESIKSKNWEKFDRNISEIKFDDYDAIYIFSDIFSYIDQCCPDTTLKQMAYRKMGEQLLQLQEKMLCRIYSEKKNVKDLQIVQLRSSFYLLVKVLDRILCFIKSPWSKNSDYSLLLDCYTFVVAGHTLLLERYQKLYWSISNNLWKGFFSQYALINKGGKNRFIFKETAFLNQLKDTSQIDDLTSTCNLLYQTS